MLPTQYKNDKMGTTMNDPARTAPAGPGEPAAVEAKPKPGKNTAMSRIKLALLEQYASGHEKTGNDPYNSTSSSAKPDQWRGNARRI